jgi:hypothetical protein
MAFFSAGFVARVGCRLGEVTQHFGRKAAMIASLEK